MDFEIQDENIINNDNILINDNNDEINKWSKELISVGCKKN